MKKKWLGGGGTGLIASLVNGVLFQHERRPESFNVYTFCTVILSYFKDRDLNISVEDIEKTGKGIDPRHRDTSARYFFFNSILPKIIRFSRTNAETDALVMVLLEEILKTISQPIYTKMERPGLMSTDPNIMRGISS